MSPGLLVCYAATGDRLARFETSTTGQDCDDLVDAFLAGVGIEPDEDGGAIFCLAVTGQPGDRFEVTQAGVPVAVVVRA